MVGVTSIQVQESLDNLAEQLRQAKTPTIKERLQVLYWLKQEHASSISAIAKALGKHRSTVQTWLSMYRDGGVESMVEIKKSPGGVRVIPQWAEDALALRLQQPNHGFQSYGEVQQWLAETLAVEAEYHAVYQSPSSSTTSVKERDRSLIIHLLLNLYKKALVKPRLTRARIAYRSNNGDKYL